VEAELLLVGRSPVEPAVAVLDDPSTETPIETISMASS
jgi:hypothetical protein